MPRTGFAIAAGLPYRDLIEVAQAAEAQGYDSLWLTEGGAQDIVSRLTVLAVNTQRIKLGTGIMTIFARTPGILAQTAASLDELSGGRFILGLGSGHRQAVERSQGIPFRRPLARMRDYIAIIRAALKDYQVSYRGEAYVIEDFRLGVRGHRAHLPIYISTLGPRMAEVAGEIADGILPLLATPTAIEALLTHVAAGAQRAGRDMQAIEAAAFIPALASPDRTAAEEEARRSIARYGSMPFYQNVLRTGGFPEEVDTLARAWSEGGEQAPRQVSNRMLEALTLIGDTAAWRRTLDAFRRAGTTLPVVYGVPVGSDAKASLLAAVRTLSPEDLRA